MNQSNSISEPKLTKADFAQEIYSKEPLYLLFSPFLSYIKGSLVNTSDSVSLFYYIEICKTDWNWKRAPKKCGPGPPTKMWPRAPHSLSPAL